jgi:hypothetical protein
MSQLEHMKNLVDGEREWGMQEESYFSSDDILC